MPSVYAPPGSDLATRLMAMSQDEPVTGCREWIAALESSGYGHLNVSGMMRKAHRVSYETFVEPIPEGMVIDHLCFNRACVNPEHLRVVTKRENDRNKLAALLPHCAHGHEYTPDNTYWSPGMRKRECRKCRRDRGSRQDAKRKAQRAARRSAAA